MPARVSPLKIPKLIGRLSQTHYIPVYDLNRDRRKQKSAMDKDWNDYSGYDYKSSRLSQNESNEFPSTYVGIRQPLPMAKVEAKYGTPVLPESPQKPEAESQIIHKKKHRPRKQAEDQSNAAKGKDSPRRQKLVKVEAVDATAMHRIPNSTLHLPQLMKSFIPSISRKGALHAHVGGKSSWIDLTSSRKVKQVAPSPYKISNKSDTILPRVTLVTVDYETTPPKLSRRPLPPLNSTSPKSVSFQQPSTPTVWHPAESQTKKSQEGNKNTQAGRTTLKIPTQIQEAKNKALENLLEKLDKARKLNLPNDSLNRFSQNNKNSTDFWESSTKHKVLRSRRRKRVESDRHFGNLKAGVVLNKLPSDLIGNYQKNFQNLEYYLGRIDPSRPTQRDDITEHGIVNIPTGRSGDFPDMDYESEKDEDMTNHYFMRRLTQKRNDVKIRYAHRDANETPTLDHLPWEEPERKSILTRPSVSIVDCHVSDENFDETRKKMVKHLTINMPKVPPPSPDSQTGRPKSRGKRTRIPEYDQNCRYCGDAGAGNVEVKRRLPYIEKLPYVEPQVRVTNGQELPATKGRHKNRHFKTFDGGIDGKLKTETVMPPKQEKLRPVKPENRYALTDKLVMAHGALKRRHKCPKKEVVIAPFKVSIEEEEKTGVKSDGDTSSSNDHNTFNRTTITKPFTFSYIPLKSKEGRKINIDKGQSAKIEAEEPSIICNDQKHTTDGDLGKTSSSFVNSKSSFISSFVSVNQSKQIYEALLKNKDAGAEEVEDYSLNKATDCDGIGDLDSNAENSNMKSQERMKTMMVSRQKHEGITALQSHPVLA